MPTFAEVLVAEPELRGMTASIDDGRYIASHTASVIQFLEAICTRYADRVAFGERRPDEPAFTPTTYGDLWRRASAFATALKLRDVVRPNERVGICGFASVDWVVADIAALYLQGVSVPLQANLPAESLRHIITETELVCVACSVDDLPRVREIVATCPSVRLVVAFDDRGTHTGPEPSMAQLEREGHAAGIAPPEQPKQLQRTLCIMYTSGSSGRPKGVVYREDRWLGFLLANVRLDQPIITVGYLPLCHTLGRGLVVYTTLVTGGRINFTAARDLSTLLTDIRITRPTILALVPRVSGLIYQHYKTELVRRTGPDATPAMREAARRAVRSEMRAGFLGDRLGLAYASGAPTAPEILEFLEHCFGINVMNHYGSTDLGPIALNGRIHDSLEFELADVPELGYRTTDKPYPRGELRVRSPELRARYFRNADADAAITTANGFLRTGDIVELRAPRQIAIIDRRENVLKLAQGEFVSTSRLEDIFLTDIPAVAQIYVHADSLEAFTIAVIVPHDDAVRIEIGDAATNPTAVKGLLRREIDRVARERELASHEVPRELIVEPQPFTVENQLLTETNKPRRPGFRTVYGERLRTIYDEVRGRQRATVVLDDGSTRGRVRAAIVATIGVPPGDAGDAVTFASLGGDSLGAVSLAAALEEALGCSPPASDLLGPTATVAAIAAAIDALRLGGANQPTFDRVHGTAARIVAATDLDVRRLLGDAIARLGTLPPPSPPGAILLTGATGFLGRSVLLELLERGAEVHCLVRGTDDDAAAARLRATMSPQLTARIDRATGRLVVVAGDVANPQLGLAPEAYARLVEHIDVVIHGAALVNHAFAYPQLFRSNVVGTLEVARFALVQKRKSIGFLSSVAAIAGQRWTAPVRERDRIADLLPRRPVGDPGQIAVGYGTSKWASEILLAQLHDAYGLPIRIYRSAMLLPHRTLPEYNAPDLFCRLLRGIRLTGLAPRSFYAGRPVHYDGVAVDEAAAAIAAITLHGGDGMRTFHISNDQWNDGVSLDRMVDWLAAAGWPIERVDDHATWHRQFRDRLERLDEPARRMSPLPVISRWEQPDGPASLVLDTSEMRRALRELLGVPAMRSLDADYLRHVAALLG